MLIEMDLALGIDRTRNNLADIMQKRSEADIDVIRLLGSLLEHSYRMIPHSAEMVLVLRHVISLLKDRKDIMHCTSGLQEFHCHCRMAVGEHLHELLRYPAGGKDLHPRHHGAHGIKGFLRYLPPETGCKADASEDAERVLVELHHRVRRRADYLLPNIVKTLASDIDDFSCGDVLIQGIYREVASEAVFFMGTVIGHGVPAAAVRI